MLTTMAYLPSRHDTTALRPAGLPLAIRQLLGSLFARRQTPVASSPAELAQREAERVRRLADGLRKTDPGFASDLYAAANRHEVESGCDC